MASLVAPLPSAPAGATMQQGLTALLPYNDAAEALFARLGFQRGPDSPDDNRMLSDGLGGFIHLNRAMDRWLQAGRNRFGPYLYREDVDCLTASSLGRQSDNLAICPGNAVRPEWS
jgi:hypothetical protein